MRLPFGASAGPSLSSATSEPIFDLCNDIVAEPSWDPSTLKSPHSHHLAAPEYLDKSIPFAHASQLLINLPVREISFDGCIDGVIAIALD